MTKKWIIIGILLIVLGLFLFVGAAAVTGWDLSTLSVSQFETNTYEISDPFQDIHISTDTANIRFLPSDDGKTKVICHEDPKAKHLTSLQDGTLSIEVSNTRKWYDYITIFHFETPSITVYLPSGTYKDLIIRQSTGNTQLPEAFVFETIRISGSTGHVDCRSSVTGLLQIQVSTGDIHVEAVNAGEVDLTVSTGMITLSSVTCEGDLSLRLSTGKATLLNTTCQNLTSTGDTGDLLLTNVIAAGKFDLQRDTGDIRFDRCDASELFVKTDTGHVTGSLLTAKVFLVHTDTGHVRVPSSTTGGKCEIRTDTGDIRIDIS